MALIPHGDQISSGYKTVKTRIKQAKSLMPEKKAVVSPCLKKWFSALTTPFAQDAQMSCIPAGSNIDSARYMCYVRGDIYIGTAGLGFLSLAPSPYNDTVVGYVSNALFGGVNCSVLSAPNTLAAGVSTLNFPNARYSSVQALAGQYALPVQARIVGGGLKVYYTGTELNKSGLLSIYTNPTHQSSAYSQGNPATPASLGSLQETAIIPVTREPYEYPLAPLKESELNYVDFTPNFEGGTNTPAATLFAYPWSGGNQFVTPTFSYQPAVGPYSSLVVAGTPTTTLVVTGVAGQTLHFEYALHVEAVGDLTEGMRVGADADVVGVDTMMAALSRFQIARNSKPHMSAAAVLREEYSNVARMRGAKVAL